MAKTTSEQVIDYEGRPNATWWQNKLHGLRNRYYKYKRYLEWYWHINTQKIELNYDKIAADSMPILINNFNRLELLQQQLDWLMTLDGKISIIIVDNDSCYPPLLEFYENLNYDNVQVVYLGFNSWRLGLAYFAKKLMQFEKLIITDSDLIPYSSTPPDVIPYLSHLLDKYKNYNHVGLSLEINDLPDSSLFKKKVLKYETQFWEPKAQKLNEEVYVGKIDTTFAMYRNNSKILITHPALRTARPYTLKHVEWYLSQEDFTEEYWYYLKSCKGFATWATELKKDVPVENNNIKVNVL